MVRSACCDEFRHHFENLVVPPHILLLEEFLVDDQEDVVFDLLLAVPSADALALEHLHFSLTFLLPLGELALEESLLGLRVELRVGILLQHG